MRRPTRTRATLPLVVIALVLAGCGGSRSEGSSPSSAASAPPASALPAGSRYVALGSSFAAGPGVPPQQPGSGPCARSDANYPNLIAQSLRLELTDVSCSGATTSQLLNERQGTARPQIDAVTADTALVTVTVGGNDLRYSASTIVCAASKADCVPTLDRSAVDEAAADLPSRLSTLVTQLRQRAPRARIVLVGYPKVIPPEGSACSALALSVDEAKVLGDLGSRLNAIFAAVSAGTGTDFVDLYSVTDGHGPCAPDNQRWVNGAAAGPTGIAFHPNANGHRAMADLTLTALHSAPRPRPSGS